MRSLLPADRTALTEHEAKEVISLWGIPVTREERAGSAAGAAAAARRIGYPVVLKVDSPDIPHKTEAGAVRVGIRNERELRRAYREIMEGARAHQPDARIIGVLVQEMVPGGVEVIVGASRDPTFGPVLLFGIGGVHVEVYQDVAMRVCPISRADAEEMVAEVKGSRLLQGYRGRPAADVDALVGVLLKTAALAVELQNEVVQLDINPLAVLPRSQGVKALDALMVLG